MNHPDFNIEDYLYLFDTLKTNMNENALNNLIQTMEPYIKQAYNDGIQRLPFTFKRYPVNSILERKISDKGVLTLAGTVVSVSLNEAYLAGQEVEV